MKLSRLGAVLLAVPLALAGCAASPPEHGDAGVSDLGGGKYAARATCAAPLGNTPPICPGASCAANALGPPDGLTVDLAACPVLDLAFAGGTIVARPVGPGAPAGSDVELRLGAAAGLTRVEASPDGVRYTLVAFVAARAADLPLGTAASCAAPLVGAVAAVSFTRCQTVAQAAFLRLTRDDEVTGAATVDAVEAPSFVPSTR